MGEGYNLSLLLGNISSVKASGIFSNSEDPLSGLAIHGGKMGSMWTGVEPSPCFSIFLARTTFVLESLPEAKILARMLFLRILSLTVVIADVTA